MRKIIWALPLATVLAMAIGIPSASAATKTISATSSYSPADDTQVSGVAPMLAGDCKMVASLRVSRPIGGFSKVRFLFDTWTTHTTGSDQWHNSWKIIDFGNRQVATVSTINGLQMPVVNQPYDGEIDTSVPMTVSDWFNIAEVIWTGSC
jgi:hypothetical protein